MLVLLERKRRVKADLRFDLQTKIFSHVCWGHHQPVGGLTPQAPWHIEYSSVAQ